MFPKDLTHSSWRVPICFISFQWIQRCREHNGQILKMSLRNTRNLPPFSVLLSLHPVSLQIRQVQSPRTHSRGFKISCSDLRLISRADLWDYTGLHKDELVLRQDCCLTFIKPWVFSDVISDGSKVELSSQWERALHIHLVSDPYINRLPQMTDQKQEVASFF